MSATDGSEICARCLEWQTRCGLCMDMAIDMIKGPEHPDNIRVDRAAAREDMDQERSIRRSSEQRYKNA
jgi:hypothetical protein